MDCSAWKCKETGDMSNKITTYDDQKCVDTNNGALNSHNMDCSFYILNPDFCQYKTDTFDPMEMCCACKTDALSKIVNPKTTAEVQAFI